MMKVKAVTGIAARNAPILRMSCSWCMPWMTEPEPKKRRALKNACVTMWKIAATYAPEPIAKNMKPSWETVEYASTRLMSCCATAMVAAKSAVAAPTTAMVSGTQPYDAASTGPTRVIKNTPAVTIVAAWMSAETGVGPSIASGNQKYNGSCALFPQAPTKSKIAIAEIAVCDIEPSCAASLIALYDTEPTAENATNIAVITPQSPMRLVTNAFLPATAALSRVCQNEMRKYEHAPTPSQPRNVTSRFSPSTSASIEKTNKLRYKKNLENFGSPCM